MVNCLDFSAVLGPRSRALSEQVTILQSLFPELKVSSTFNEDIALPPDAEGWFAIPRWEKLATTYRLALERLLKTLSEQLSGNLYRYPNQSFDKMELEQLPETVAAMELLGQKPWNKDSDILIFAAQLGIAHINKSRVTVRTDLQDGEFALGGFAVGSILLAHPWYIGPGLLDIDCPGDEAVCTLPRTGKKQRPLPVLITIATMGLPLVLFRRAIVLITPARQLGFSKVPLWLQNHM